MSYAKSMNLGSLFNRGFVLLVTFICLSSLYSMSTATPYSSKAIFGDNQVTEGLVTRSPYVQNVELSNSLVKLGLYKDGSMKSKADIIQDYKNVLTGVIPNATLNSLISSINNDPNFNLLSTEKLRMMALRNHAGELFDENYAKFYLNKLYYDPSKPNEKYYFVFTNLQSTQCDENNVCVNGFVYHNNYYLAR